VPGACLLCRYKIPAIKTPIGTVDVPIGLCQKLQLPELRLAWRAHCYREVHVHLV